LSITYRRQGRILEAIELMRNDPSAEELIFFVRAWKAAFAKAHHSAGFTDVQSKLAL
jgi:hypothetical protein